MFVHSSMGYPLMDIFGKGIVSKAQESSERRSQRSIAISKEW